MVNYSKIVNPIISALISHRVSHRVSSRRDSASRRSSYSTEKTEIPEKHPIFGTLRWWLLFFFFKSPIYIEENPTKICEPLSTQTCFQLRMWSAIIARWHLLKRPLCGIFGRGLSACWMMWRRDGWNTALWQVVACNEGSKGEIK